MTALAIAAALTLSACASDPAPTDDPAAEAPADGSDAGGDEAAGGSLTFTGTDEVAWAESEKSVAPGSVEVTIECGEAVEHGLGIDGVQGGAELAACDAGGTGAATVELEAGEYTYFCTVPGHRDAGMEGTLTVG